MLMFAPQMKDFGFCLSYAFESANSKFQKCLCIHITIDFHSFALAFLHPYCLQYMHYQLPLNN
jgi:hypothetical protein